MFCWIRHTDDYTHTDGRPAPIFVTNIQVGISVFNRSAAQAASATLRRPCATGPASGGPETSNALRPLPDSTDAADCPRLANLALS